MLFVNLIQRIQCATNLFCCLNRCWHQGETKLIFNQSHLAHQTFHARWVAIYKQQFHHLDEAIVDSAALLQFTCQSQAHHTTELFWERIAYHRDDAHSTKGNQWEGDGIVARDNEEMLWFLLDDFVNLTEIARRLFHADDVWTFACQSQRCIGIHIRTRSARHVIEHHRQFRVLGNHLIVLIDALLRRFVVVRHHREDGTDALEVDMFEGVNNLLCVVASHAHHDRDAAAHLTHYGMCYHSFLLVGQRLGQGDDFTTASLIAIIDALDRHELTASIRSIDLTTPLAITLRASNGLTVHLGQPTDLDAKMASLAKLLPQFLKQNITTGVLYLSAKGGTVYSPSGADQLALARKEAEAAAAAQAQMLAEINDFVDDDGDGVDDVTGEDIILTTPDPELTPTPAPTPTPKLPGGSADDFSG